MEALAVTILILYVLTGLAKAKIKGSILKSGGKKKTSMLEKWES